MWAHVDGNFQLHDYEDLYQNRHLRFRCRTLWVINTWTMPQSLKYIGLRFFILPSCNITTANLVIAWSVLHTLLEAPLSTMKVYLLSTMALAVASTTTMSSYNLPPASLHSVYTIQETRQEFQLFVSGLRLRCRPDVRGRRQLHSHRVLRARW